ncbi:MAG: Holliday junction branch migration protein RuvA [Planctomycetes bacterium]|nr:Holliday junction branch migration protein RuvA [Planctomycetota bacterium]
MFDFLDGRLESVAAAGVVVSTGGVGWQVSTSARTADAVEPGQELRLLVHLVVSDNALTLFGFLEQAERAAFRRLIQVSGVGPAMALGLLSALPPGELAAAVRARDTGALTRVKGVGKKTAERLLVEIGDGLEELALAAGPRAAGGGDDELLRVLVDLGFRPLDARSAADAARHRLGPEADFEDLLRHALQNPSKT